MMYHHGDDNAVMTEIHKIEEMSSRAKMKIRMFFEMSEGSRDKIKREENIIFEMKIYFMSTHISSSSHCSAIKMYHEMS